jgi:SAM-dependent methyltransferase
MKYLIHLLTRKPLVFLTVRFFLWFHSFSYKVISASSIAIEGTHVKKRLTYIYSFFLDNITTANCVMDIGANNGDLTQEISKIAKKVIAIEIDKKQFSILKNNVGHIPNIELILGDATSLDLNLYNIDTIIMSNVLEHIEYRVIFLRKLKENYPNSKLFIRVPTIQRDWVVLYKKFYGMNYLLDDTHFIEFTEDELKTELADANWNIVKFERRYDEFYLIAK